MSLPADTVKERFSQLVDLIATGIYNKIPKMADWFKLNIPITSVSFPSDTYTVENWVNKLQTSIIANNSNNEILLQIPAPILNISPYTWEINETNSTEETSVDIQATFADGSVSDKITVSFSRPYNAIVYLPLADNQGVILNGAKAIDTKQYLEISNEFFVKGCLKSESNQAVLLGAYTSNSERTVLKILGQSKKFQSQWTDNKEILSSNLEGWDLTKPFEYHQTYNKADISQNGKTVTVNNSSSLDVDFYNVDTKIYLFNQTADGIYNNGVFFSATISNENDSKGIYIYKYTPMIKRNTLTKEETVVIMVESTDDYTAPGEDVRELPLPEGASLEVVTFD